MKKFIASTLLVSLSACLSPAADTSPEPAADIASQADERPSQIVILRPGAQRIRPGIAPPLSTSPLVIPQGDIVDRKTGKPQDFAITFRTEEPYYWFTRPDGSFSLEVEAGKLLSGNSKEKLCMTVWTWRNQPIHQELIALPANQSFTFQFDGRGVYLLTFDRVIDDRKGDKRVFMRTVRSIAALPDNTGKCAFWREPEFILGAAAYPERQTGYRAAADRMQKQPPGLTHLEAAEFDAILATQLGLGAIRIGYEGESPHMPDPYWGLRLYDDMDFYIYYKIGQNQNAPLLPHYADVTEPHWKYPRESAANRAFFGEVILNSRDRVDHYEILNEVNGGFFNGTMEEYFQIFDDFIEPFEELNTGQTVSSAGHAGITNFEKIEQINAYVLPKVDTYSFHTYAPIDYFQNKSEAAHRANVRENGFEVEDFRWMMGEINRSNFDNDHEGLDVEFPYAAMTMQNLLYCYQSGYEAFFFFELRDMRGTRMNPVSEYEGMLDYFYCPRALWGMTSAFIDLMTGYRPDGVIYRDDASLEVYQFAEDDSSILAFINKNQSGSLEPEGIILKAGPGVNLSSLAWYDEMGNRLSPGTTLTVNLPPLYLESSERFSIEKVAANQYTIQVAADE